MNRESSDQLLTETIIIVTNDEFIEIITEYLEDYANMFPKNDKILNFDNIRLMILISFLNKTQYLDLNKGLL